MRCDVASAGASLHPVVEVRSGTALIPEADFVSVDMSPAGVWCLTYDWQGVVYLRTSGGLSETLGSRNPNNAHKVRWIPNDNQFRTYRIYTPDGVTRAGEMRRVSADGVGIVGQSELFDALESGSQGILDVTDYGAILWWSTSYARQVDGLILLNWKERGDYISGVLSHTWLGVSVFQKSTGIWRRPYFGDVQLIPGLAENGTTAVSAEPGGFFPIASAHEFNPHEPIDPPDPEPEIPRMIAYNSPVAGFLKGELVKHPDGDPYVAIRKPNGKFVCCTPDGAIEERDEARAWERYTVSKNGASLKAERDGNRVYVLPLVE